jgi:hypothetical protein
MYVLKLIDNLLNYNQMKKYEKKTENAKAQFLKEQKFKETAKRAKRNQKNYY